MHLQGCCVTCERWWGWLGFPNGWRPVGTWEMAEGQAGEVQLVKLTSPIGELSIDGGEGQCHHTQSVWFHLGEWGLADLVGF